MTYVNNICADAGTVNCPCHLAETGDCLVCSRLAGEGKCQCSWAGFCIYNEFIHNDGKAINRRRQQRVKIIEKIRYDDNLLVLVLGVNKGFLLNAAKPGSFVFVKKSEDEEFFDVPVSVMKVDVEKGELHIAVKIISAKTRAIAEAEDFLVMRGVYRNGLLGEGIKTLGKDEKWLIFTKGVGFAPAVNLLMWAEGRSTGHLVIDTEKINDEIIYDYINKSIRSAGAKVTITTDSLRNAVNYGHESYDKVIILASDYYIKTIAADLGIPKAKLIFSNNFHMCCGEGVCGACGHVDSKGNTHKMCKCRSEGFFV